MGIPDKRTHLPFWLLNITLFFALIISVAVQHGMFIDGLAYATIARNIAEGSSSFWQLQFTKSVMHDFASHPPLAFNIQSVFFKLLGNAFWVEKFYSVLCLLATAYLMVLSWKLIFPKESKVTAWLPILLWIIMPLVFWAYVNNILENTMAVFTTASILLQLKSRTSGKSNCMFAFFGGVFLVLAVYVKGPVALFPLAFYPLHFIIYREGLSSYLRLFLAFLLPVVLGVVFTILSPLAYDYWQRYVNEQLVYSLSGHDVVVDRYYIIQRLLAELAVPAVVIVLILMIARILKAPLNFPIKIVRPFLLFFMLGLSASLPMVVSPKQLMFYLLPSLPLFALALAVLIFPVVSILLSKVNAEAKAFKFVNVCLFLLLFASAAFSFSQWGKIGRDELNMHNAAKIAEFTGKGESVGIPFEIYDHWGLHAYLARYYKVNLIIVDDDVFEYYLTQEGLSVLTNYEMVEETGIQNYLLFRRVSP